MRSNINLDDISDGRLYAVSDLVKADTGGCLNCGACCHGVGDLVVLNPFDVNDITKHLNKSFDELLMHHFELHESGKITLPHLKMQGEADACSFLDANARCAVHGHRPDICRLFPLGRVYDQDDFQYFLQTDVCVKSDLEDITVESWIGVSDYAKNKAFILEWYRLIKALTFRVKFIRDSEELAALNTYLLDTFYRLTLKENDDFYTAFYERLPVAKTQLGIL